MNIYTKKTCWLLTFCQIGIVGFVLWQNYTIQHEKHKWRELAKMGVDLSTELADELETYRAENDALTAMYFTQTCEVEQIQ